MRRASRLLSETSPYLLQHAQNPVDWYPWGEEALARAKVEDKPILLSIGYAACHWCHVMAHESFEDEHIAELLNEHFVCIKVDREERPDLDEIYMAATLALNGHGGWPMTVFLTPTGEPFFAGTYFPPHDGERGLGFSTLVQRISEMWKDERSSLQKQARELTDHVKHTHQLLPPTGVSEDALFSACRTLNKQFDFSFGGFGGPPKFPPTAALRLLLRQHLRTGQKELRTMVKRTLDMMMSGGLFDQLGGGFARYSVDNKWLVPHFEKMLYDNALLADVYLEAFQVTGRASYRAVVRETLDYLLREMQSPSGGFFSSSDADSDGVEGAYYLWTRKQIRDVLGEPLATHFCEFFGVSEAGNFEGTNVLSTRRTLKEVSKELGIADAELVSSIEMGRAMLLEARTSRTPPAVDDKVLCGHNGLTIRSLANAARAFSEERYLKAACRAADFILGEADRGTGMLETSGRLRRSYRAGRATGTAFLEDYAFLADGLLSLYEAGGGIKYLAACQRLCDRMCEDFGPTDDEPPQGALYSTPRNHEPLISRPISGHDEALPSGNAVAARVLSRLAFHTQETKYREQAVSIIYTFSSGIKRSPRAYCTMLCVLDFLLQSPVEVVLSGSPEDESFRAMSKLLGETFLPHRVEARLFSETDAQASPLCEDRFEAGISQTFVCRDFVCQAPAFGSSELSVQLERVNEERKRDRRRELVTAVLGGRASEDATQNHRDTGPLGPSAFSRVGDLWVTKVGLGTYRVGLDRAEHKHAVEKALLSGINLIDTSPTFALGDSERLVGQVIAELSSQNKIRRDSLVVVSKVGVAVGPLSAELEQRRLDGTLSGTAVPLSHSGPRIEDASLESGAYCLQPEFIREQVETTLARLGLCHLDVCLLQSPEHLLAAGLPKHTVYEIVGAAFAALRQLVKEDKIGCYGVLSNTLTDARGGPLALSLEQLLLAADEAGARNHFRVLELPINLLESAALESENGASLVERAKHAGLSVISCRPLSAMNEGALLRLVDPPVLSDNEKARDLSGARYRVASLEAEFETTFAAALRLSGQVGREAVLPLSGRLGQTIERVETLSQFNQAETTLLTPRLRQLLAQLDSMLEAEPRWPGFRDKYVSAVGVWLECLRQSAIEKTRARLHEIQPETLAPSLRAHINADFHDYPWVRRALEPLLRTDGIAAVLLGMRNEDHVEAALSILRASAVSNDQQE